MSHTNARGWLSWYIAIAYCSHPRDEGRPCLSCIMNACTEALAAAVKAKGEAMLADSLHEYRCPGYRGGMCECNLMDLASHVADVPEPPPMERTR